MNERSAAASDGFADTPLGERIGADALRYGRTFVVPIERLWHAITTPADLAVWLGPAIALDLVAGGRFTIALSDADRMDGRILEVDPPKRLAIIWQETSGGVRSPYGMLEGARSLATFDCSANAAGGTDLVFTHRFVVAGHPMIGFGVGWHVTLEALRARVAGAGAVDRAALYGRLEPLYQRHLATTT